jgi:hypothetical protein
MKEKSKITLSSYSSPLEGEEKRWGGFKEKKNVKFERI